MREILLLGTILVFLPQTLFAQMVITEIMYDLPRSDTGREWVEIQNTSSSPIDFSSWRFVEANTAHNLTISQGNKEIPASGFAIIADNPAKFLIDWPSFSGTIFDSTFSLSNTGETLSLKNGDVVIDTVSYTSAQGANGDGNTLQKIGSTWTVKSATPGLSNGSDFSGGNTTTTNTNTNTSTTTETTSAQEVYSNFPVDPQIFANITAPNTAVAGADTIFRGEALGLKKEIIPGARLFWNFGDGGTREGNSVTHTYFEPGDYRIVLTVTSDKYQGTAYARIKVIAPEVSITSVHPGMEGGITIANNSSAELNLSWWQLKSNGEIFIFPEQTVVLPKSKITFSAKITGVSATSEDTALFYPNGTEAVKFHGSIYTQPVQTKSDSEVASISQTQNNISNISTNKKENNTEIVSKQTENSALQASVDSVQGGNISSQKGGLIWPISAGILILGSAGTAIFLRRKNSKEFEIVE